MGVQFGDNGPTLTVEMALEDSIGTPYRDVVACDKPTVWYRLGEAGFVIDWSGNGFVPAVHGGVTFGVAGLIAGDTDKAASFDGTTGYLSATADVGYMPTTALTLSTMVKLSALPGLGSTAYILTFGDFSLIVDHTGGITYEFKDGVGVGGTVGDLTLSNKLAAGVAAWIVATDDGATVRLYIDGVLRVERQRYELGVSTATFNTTLSTLYVGGPAGATLAGVVDEVAIWKDVALTPTQIARQAAARAQITEPAWTDMTDRLR